MGRTIRYSTLLVLFFLGIMLPRLAEIFPVQAQVIDDQSNTWSALQNTPTLLTVTSTATSAPFLSNTPAGTLTNTSLPVDFSPGNVYAFIQTPVGHVSRPYAVLSGFVSIAQSNTVAIRGFVNATEFVCSDVPCVVYFEGSSRFVFRAVTETGASSEEVIASVNVVQDSQGYLVTIDSVSLFASFVDSCSIIWGKRDEDNAQWDSFVQFPYQLNTKKTLHTLAAQLLLNGIVDASSCKSGGLSIGLDWPTACGLEKASDEMLKWQNQFNEYIWLASKERGIPPKILKTLIEMESQFWPGNSRFYLDEFGLGQLNQLGVDVVLRKDPGVYLRVCEGVIVDCSIPYTRLEKEEQELIRGALIKSIDATCPSCENGLDLDKARDSIGLVADLLKADCQQVQTILGKDIKDADYEDLWRFTLGAYHSGITCFYNAVEQTRSDKKHITWNYVSTNLKCGRGDNYVNGFMDNLFAFDYYTYETSNLDKALVAPTIIPTRTLAPTPTPFISNALVKVQVYMDRNGNNVPDDGEWIDGMSVLLTTSDNDQVELRTENGIAIFNMNQFRPGLHITISLPGLYRSENFTLPAQGEIVVTFKFDQPALPTILP